MMKKITFVLVALLAIPGLTLAANDVTFPQIATIELDDGSTYTVDDTSTFDSFTVNATNITFDLSASSKIALTSPDRKDFEVSGTTSDMTVTEVCGSDVSSLQIDVNSTASGSTTVTVTPSGTCSTATNPGGGGTPAPDTGTPEGSTSPGGGTGAPGGGGAGSTGTGTTAEPTSPLSSLDGYSSGGGQVILASPVTGSVNASNGGEISLNDSSVSISLPPAAVTTDSSVTITPQANYAQPLLGYAAVGSQVYNITAQTNEGVTITQIGNSASLTFSYTGDQISGFDENSLVVSYWAEETGEWIDLPTTIDSTNNTVTATVDHLTKFILQGITTTAPVGSLIKTADSSAVYYLGRDNKRYVFPDDKVFFTWYENFNNVMTISNQQMVSFSLGGNISVRHGTKLLQFVAYDYSGNMIVDDPHIYAVEPGGTIRWIETPEVAAGLYGTDWEQKINPVNNYLFGDYSQGDSITEPTFPTGAVVKETSTNNLYYINGSQKRLITTNGRVSNKFQEQHYLSATTLDNYETGASLTDYQNSISWTEGK